MMIRRLPFSTACVVATTMVAATGTQSSTGDRALVVLDNARARVFKTRGASLAGVDHRAGVVIELENSAAGRVGDARWARDAAAQTERHGAGPGPLIIVEPKDVAAAAAPPAEGSKPGEAVFSGMSFKTMFENEKVTAIERECRSMRAKPFIRTRRTHLWCISRAASSRTPRTGNAR